MSWRELQWRGSEPPRDPSRVGNGFVTSIGVTVGGEAPAAPAARPKGRSALAEEGPGGVSVTVEPMRPEASPARRPGRLR